VRPARLLLLLEIAAEGPQGTSAQSAGGLVRGVGRSLVFAGRVVRLGRLRVVLSVLSAAVVVGPH
jgi:hypothetical protein